MTNYGALTILALPRLPNARMAPSEADLRLMVSLETFPPRGGDWNGDRVVGTRLLAEQSGMNRKTVLRARDRLVKAGLIECEPGTGTAQSTWRLLFTLTPPSGPIHDGTASGPIHDGTTSGSGGVPDGTTSRGVDINMGPLEPGAEPLVVPNEGRSGPSQDGTTLLSTTALKVVEVGEPADRAGARPIEGRVLARGGSVQPRNACEFCGDFGHITARCRLRDLAQEERDDRLKAAARNGEPVLRLDADRRDTTAADGAALARKLLADRPGKPPEEVTAPRTDDERRAFARRQVSAARSVRDPAPDEAPLWQEEDPDEPPF